MKRGTLSRRRIIAQLAIGGAALSAACAAPAASPTAAPPTAAPKEVPAKPTAAPASKPAEKPAEKPAAKPAATTAPAAPKTREKATVRMDFAFYGYHAPFFYAKAKGYYEQEGLDVTVAPGQGSNSVAQQIAIKPEETPFGFIVPEAVIRGTAQGMNIKMVSNVLAKGASAFFFYRPSGIKTLKDFEGRTLGDVAGGFLVNLSDAMLRANGVDVSKVQRVTLDVTVKNQSLLQKKVDIITGPSYLVAQLEAVGSDPIDMILFADHGFPVLGHGIATHNDLISKKPDMVRGFVKATLRAVQEAKEKPEAALEVMAKEMPDAIRGLGGDKAQTQLLKLALDLTHTPAMQGKPLGFQVEDDWKQTIDIITRYGDVKGDIPPTSQLYTNDFLPK